MAIAAQAMGGGKLSDVLVLSTDREMTAEEMALAWGWNGNDSES